MKFISKILISLFSDSIEQSTIQSSSKVLTIAWCYNVIAEWINLWDAIMPTILSTIRNKKFAKKKIVIILNDF
ncbi:MAG: hypothetical protein DRO88_08590 [Promethearchaeia archaeon]|nr:MAG: hypothetical protein DRO88_08590 [Candidatus Lokiarchaeia archaeon]